MRGKISGDRHEIDQGVVTARFAAFALFAGKTKSFSAWRIVPGRLT
jgi:hypothetical protein